MNNERASVDNSWIEEVRQLLSHWESQYTSDATLNVIASPDLDGVLSILLLQKHYSKLGRVVRVIGIYTTIELYLCDEADEQAAHKALWVDHDMLDNLLSIGNHLSRFACNDGRERINRHPLAFNLNDRFGQGYADSFRGLQATQRDKCPFGTSHIIAQALMRDELDQLAQRQPYHSIFAYFAHADSLWLCAHWYTPSTRLWYQSAFGSAAWLRFATEPTVYSSDARRLEQHERLVKKLSIVCHGSFQKSTSSSIDEHETCVKRLLTGNAQCLDAERWASLRGNQGLAPNYFLTVEQRNGGWLKAFCAMFQLVGASFSEECLQTLVLPHCITSQHKGQLHQVDPSEWTCANDFEHLMQAEHANSIAITNHRTLRYTNNLFECSKHTCTSVAT